MKTVIKPPVAILGFGVEGQSAFEFLKTQNISDITICDEKESVELPADTKSQLGPSAFDDLTIFQTIIRSPGVRYNLPGILKAKTAGRIVTSMTELTLETAANRLTAVTGSNGKTTTTGMIERILRAHYGNEIIVGGNDRKPVLEEALSKPWPILLEVSSFQFADLKMSPHISVVLNITPNHLDWHENEADYINAKTNLIAHQTPNDWAVLNAADENSAKLADKAPGQIFWLNKKPARRGGEGKAWAAWEGDKLITQFGNEPMEILDKKDITLKTHPDNILAAVAVSLIHDAKPTTIKKALAEFRGAEHRLEFVRELNGVKFYNDSACTTPESAIVATQAFPKGKLILLLGGSTKYSDFSFMAHHIKQTKTRVYLYGAEGERIADAMKNEGAQNLILHLDTTRDFEKIIKEALSLAKSGDNIVLSPACASFDIFKNAKDRGKKFKEIVKNL
ncbi:UDP-N-acetylmuramoyl-L-alanine--D-glutamate ligase [Patescibacteria group bacterium]|nr:UDP-N-acetylmuramoyl-L-alanine--D-glutamate ligase [Patescibacteria group bacterium]MBU1015924.1 UDP-N-acetylmuramoyl-L-alanine--D-glutamate ligase [Patescibacteria group bacterium]MBU1685093.1 UDP-N-acetylmuramoyl-L-alanine--D-glutamate ligase [Patescibacteria group bacterium]MBU1938187.1 UDP-N-acetylmuramoyl-L-alanine--D-glutamate ligase [Patescibacteria group bacterium]